jgi:predicted Zn-dependent protease
VNVGLAYARLGRVDAAMIALSRAADRFPDSPLVATALGRGWLQIADVRGDQGALRKARQALEGAAARSDASSETLGLYGRALLLSDEVSQAERVLQAASSGMPVSVAALRDLADAARRLGHTTVAATARAQYAALTAN